MEEETNRVLIVCKEAMLEKYNEKREGTIRINKRGAVSQHFCWNLKIKRSFA